MSTLETYSVNLNNYLDQYLSYLRAPITRLETQKSDLEIKSAIFSDLSTKLQALEDVLDGLSGTGTSSVLRMKTATSSDDSLVTAIATSDAAPGAHTVFVTQLAKAHSVASNRYDQSSTTLSQAQSGTKTFSISVGDETYDVSVTISAGESDQTVLSNIASAINEATGGEVVASCIMDTPSTCKLSIRSGSSGTAGKMTFTDTDSLLGTLGVTNASQATDTVGGYIYADLGSNELDALLTIDGINVISSSNVIDNALGGFSITLLGEQEVGETSTTITVSVDVESIKSEIEEFLTAYNEAFAYLVEKTRVDSTTYERGLLSGDFPYVSLRSSMRQKMNAYVGDSSFDYHALSQIGITSSRSGNFTISDESLLEEVISSDPDALENLFSAAGGIAVGLAGLLSGYTDPVGTISTSRDAITSRINLIDDRIERQEKYMELREKDLRRRYAALQEALYTLEMTKQVTASFSSLLGF
jgi:flagellar hook-associated protein 2